MARPTHLFAGLAALALAVSLSLAPTPTLAAATTAPTPVAAPQKNGTIVDKSGTDTSVPGKEYALTPKVSDTALQSFIGRLAGILIGLSGSLALLIFVWAGITMITSDGDAAKVQKAKRMMLWTAIGLLIIFVSAPAVRFILNALTGNVS